MTDMTPRPNIDAIIDMVFGVVSDVRNMKYTGETLEVIRERTCVKLYARMDAQNGGPPLVVPGIDGPPQIPLALRTVPTVLPWRASGSQVFDGANKVVAFVTGPEHSRRIVDAVNMPPMSFQRELEYRDAIRAIDRALKTHLDATCKPAGEWASTKSELFGAIYKAAKLIGGNS